MPDTPSVTPSFAGDVPVAEFRAAAHRAVDWIADYLDGEVERFPVLAPVEPGALRAALPATPPVRGEPLAAMLDDFERLVLPGITHWNHPGFLAYFANTGSVPGVLGEMLAAALNANGMLWRTSPAVTELEQHALDWLRQLMGLGDGWFGIINDTASISSLLALAAAREARAELAVRERGLAGRTDLPRLRVYTSAHSHSSVDKAAITLGLGHENVVHVPVDAEFRMRPDLLAWLVEEDHKRGFLPLAVVATVGTTSTTSVDPVPAILEVCRANDLWLHVDGAYGGVAGLVPELRHLLDGVDGADSLVVNPHKWLFTPVDCSAFYTRRPEVLQRAFSLVPEYLTTTAPDAVVNLMDYGVQLGRRFRALKLWFVLRAFGAEGLAERIRYHVALAQEFAGWVDAAPEWERLAPTPLSVVSFRYAPAGHTDAELDALNAAIMEAVNGSGRVYLSHTRLGDAYTLRLAIGNVRTERRHVEEAWQLLREAAGALHAAAS
ncbi:MAG TPA: pyridoxal-dependent decarboxylase, partial [Gemmatimonadaceae bacterium]|nr:pyridoxal-dependent decarboxylase [Gemmatimonadaceae bacterium]